MVALILACDRSSVHASPLSFREIAPGLHYAAVDRIASIGGSPHAAHVLRFEARALQLRVVTQEQTGTALADAEAFRAAVGALAAFNGGFFDPLHKPLGLLVSQGRQLSPLRKVDHGVFAIVAGTASVRHASQWRPDPDVEFAVQCGPRLLVDGEVPHFRSPQAARRTAIALDGPGRVLVVVTDAEVSLDALARWIRTPVDHGGPGAVQALNLDGGPSTMLSVRAEPHRIAVTTPVAVPVGIALLARR
ncbi:MAG: phosphodiester glycosidase family protein [Deltaproteobacteria bacterium]|nr:phosphodiester glycosidase family protein [Deltaproteobacteria bacterium]